MCSDLWLGFYMCDIVIQWLQAPIAASSTLKATSVHHRDHIAPIQSKSKNTWQFP